MKHSLRFTFLFSLATALSLQAANSSQPLGTKRKGTNDSSDNKRYHLAGYESDSSSYPSTPTQSGLPTPLSSPENNTYSRRFAPGQTLVIPTNLFGVHPLPQPLTPQQDRSSTPSLSSSALLCAEIGALAVGNPPVVITDADIENNDGRVAKFEAVANQKKLELICESPKPIDPLKSFHKKSSSF